MFPHSLTTLALQLALIECDETTLREVMCLMRKDTFRQTTPVSVVGDHIEYDVTTGSLTLLGKSRTSFKLHLIDNFLFKPPPNAMRAVDDPLRAYLSVAHQAQLRFILPDGLQSLLDTALLIDFHSWFPFAKFQFSSTPTAFSQPCQQPFLFGICCSPVLEIRAIEPFLTSMMIERLSFVY